ncbi:AraC family transcriptional regulator [Mycobacterium hubeiense]|uniref:AraC family transcriptional regulator n=1 Tax=Mycobacterium hubeiense TaxID=1867256 RepID=UPI001158DE36|nr:helix-turn-helix domain-containing protein [Mycobacterium sp. QGD 101]
MGATFVTGSPHPSLRGVVLRYEGFAQKTPGPVVIRELPGTFVPVIIDLDAGWTVADGRRPQSQIRLDSFVAGLTDGPVLVGHGGSARCLQIDLTVLGARRLLGVPMNELANLSVPLEDVLGRTAVQFVQRVGEAPDWPTRFSLIDEAIQSRLAQAPIVEPDIAWSIRQVVDSGGTTPIAHLADELGWSHRKLIARFRDVVGLPPKRVARIARFERLTAMLADGAALDWAGAATECGYFDQAHLAREVRDLAGLTPTELRAAGVNFVQDEAMLPA